MKMRFNRRRSVTTLFAAAAITLLGANHALAGTPDLGVGASLNGKPVLPRTDPWNRDVSADPVDPASAAIIARIGGGRPLHPDFGTTFGGQPNGIPYVVVRGTQAAVSVKFVEYAGESDKGPYPIPLDAPVEGGPAGTGDRHVIVVDRDRCRLYELWHAKELAGGGWEAGSGAIFDLTTGTTRPAGWTSADAAGLPIFPGLARYDEVMVRHEITHALRFTVRKSRRAYVAPARHFASSSTDAALPPMGMRVRLKASVDLARFSPPAQVILRGLKRYGMILADNGGDWFISGAPDPRWDEAALHQLSTIKGDNLEVVAMGRVQAR
jgi:hypothetical protein